MDIKITNKKKQKIKNIKNKKQGRYGRRPFNKRGVRWQCLIRGEMNREYPNWKTADFETVVVY